MGQRVWDIRSFLEEQRLPISKSSLFRAISKGDLEIIKMGKKVLIEDAAVDRYLAKLKAKAKTKVGRK